MLGIVEGTVVIPKLSRYLMVFSCRLLIDQQHQDMLKITLVEPVRVELTFQICRTSVLPLNYGPGYMNCVYLLHITSLKWYVTQINRLVVYLKFVVGFVYLWPCLVG